MIVAERKPLAEILKMLRNSRKILVLACKGCVTVCSAGGEREAEILASLVRLGLQKEGKDAEVATASLVRQCDKEYIDGLDQYAGQYDAILSTACGVGVNFIANLRPTEHVYPALNTTFFGGSAEQGVWKEMCAGCGHCVLHFTGGLCPVARCAKSLMNGPCGGSSKGKCEVSNEIDCVWQLIWDRLKELGIQDRYEDVIMAKDWSTERGGGPRKIVREDLAQ